MTRSPTEVNRWLARENEQGMFVSLFFAYYDVTTGELIYANAGHNPPYIVRPAGPLDVLDPTGPLVAPFPDATFHDAQDGLGHGDLLVLFTDGVTESGVEQGGLFGEERLERLLQSSTATPVADVCRNVIQAASDFSHGDLADDATVLALRRTCLAGTPGRMAAASPGGCTDDKPYVNSSRCAQTFSNALTYCSTSSGASEVK